MARAAQGKNLKSYSLRKWTTTDKSCFPISDLLCMTWAQLIISQGSYLVCKRKYLKVLCKPRVMCRLQISVFSLFQSMCVTVQKELVLKNSLSESYCSPFCSLGCVVGQKLQSLFQVSSGETKQNKIGWGWRSKNKTADNYRIHVRHEMLVTGSSVDCIDFQESYTW